jgi:hypothetical protein
MQLQDAFSIPKIFIGLDIHKSWTVSIKQIYFSQDLFDAMLRICINMWSEHFQIMLIYEAVVVASPQHDIF